MKWNQNMVVVVTGVTTVYVGPGLIPDGTPEPQVRQWADEQARQAVAGNDDGQSCYPAPWPSGDAPRINRIVHRNGHVSLIVAEDDT